MVSIKNSYFAVTNSFTPNQQAKMIVSLIVAASDNNAIGKNNQLMWHLPIDMKFFKNTTWGFPVIMGRKTFEELGNKALPGRQNIVITRKKDWKAEGVVIVHSLDDALFVAREAETNEIFIIGGGEIYKEAMPKANRLYITRVHAMLEGDTYFPTFDEKKWELVSSRPVKADERHQYDFTIQQWDKK